jgi:hypothetical protein
MTTQQHELIMHELPALPDLGIAGHAQLAELRRHWRLGRGVRLGAASRRQADRISPLERLYRSLDRRLFGRGQWKFEVSALDVPASDAVSSSPKRWHLAWCREAASRVEGECLCVEFEGSPMAELERAVRSRLGQPGGTLCAQVWRFRRGQAPTLAMEGRLRIDHRSLHRSIVLCATKVPALLRGAMVRSDRLIPPLDVGDPAPSTPNSATIQLLRLARSALTRLLWREQWQIEVLSSADEKSSEPRVTAVIRPPDSSFWADPFLLRRDRRTWILFEELPFVTNRGHISAIEVDASGRPISPPQVVLKEPWHLSYPFIWRDGERLYIMPEAGESSELTLYEAVGNGLEFQRRAVLISGQRLADATIARMGERLWMFATCAEPGVAGMEDALHVYWADRIEGPWHPHMLNPVKIDATSSRPAGAMHLVDGALHRAVMDCSSTYGGSVRWMRVVRLTEDEFDEVPVPGWLPNREVEPEPWHTFNKIDGMIVMDRQVRLPRWRTR